MISHYVDIEGQEYRMMPIDKQFIVDIIVELGYSDDEWLSIACDTADEDIWQPFHLHYYISYICFDYGTDLVRKWIAEARYNKAIDRSRMIDMHDDED